MRNRVFYKKYFPIIVITLIFLFFVINSLVDFRTKHSFKNNLRKIFDSTKFTKIDNLGFYISTNSKDIFSLKKNDQIFIYTNINETKSLEIRGFSKKEKNCYKKKFKLYLEIKFDDILKNCNDAYLFDGKIKYKDEQIHFLFTKQIDYKSLDKKNLIVIPISYLFLSHNNTFLLNKNDLESDDQIFVTSSKNFPMIIGEMHDYNILLKSLKFFSKISKENSYVYDFQLKNINLYKFANIIFPHHQEYLEKKTLNKIYKFLSSNIEEKKIISVGESFKHLYIYNEDNSLFKMYPSENINISDFNFVTDKIVHDKIQNCSFENNKIDAIYVNYDKIDTEDRFFKLKCDGVNYPLISEISFGKNRFINFNQENLIHLIKEDTSIFNYLNKLM